MPPAASEPIGQVYFPLSGIISLISVMGEGTVAQTAMVGGEGAVGAFGGTHSAAPWCNCRDVRPLYRWRAFRRRSAKVSAFAI